MPDNNLPNPDAIRKAEEQGLVFSEDKRTLLKCTNEKITEVVIPNGVLKIAKEAFQFRFSLKSVIIPDSVTCIEDRAFFLCTNLARLIIPNSIISIGKETFWECRSLTAIKIPNRMTCIEDGVFYGCISLNNVVGSLIGLSKMLSLSRDFAPGKW